VSYRASALFYCLVYCFCAGILAYAENSAQLGIRVIITVDLPLLLALSLSLNFLLYKSSLGKQTAFVNAVMLASMGRLVGFGLVLAITIFAQQSIALPVAIVVSMLYLISAGADAFFVKRFK